MFMGSDQPATIDDLGGAGGVSGLIGGQIGGKGGYFFRAAQAPLRLPGDKLGVDIVFVSALPFGLFTNALAQRG